MMTCIRNSGGSISDDWHRVGILCHKGVARKTMGRGVIASFCHSDFLRSGHFSRQQFAAVVARLTCRHHQKSRVVSARRSTLLSCR
jgi:hypothetical protein